MSGSGVIPLTFSSATTSGKVSNGAGSSVVAAVVGGDRGLRLVGGEQRGRRDVLEHLIGSGGQRRFAPEHGEDRPHVVAVDARLQHGVAADHAVDGFDLVRREVVLDVAQHAGQFEQPSRCQLVVVGDVAVARLDQAADDVRAEPAARQERVDHALDEVLLAGDPSEVGRRIGAPLTVDVLLEVAGAHVGQRVLAVEPEAPGLRHVEPRLGIAHRVLEGHLDAAGAVDERLERAEVDLNVVIDRYTEVLLDRVDQTLRIVAAVRGVDPALARRAGDRHPQIPGEREHRDLRRRRIDPPHHDRVAALAHRGAVAEGVRELAVGVDAGVVVSAGDEEVLRRRLPACGNVSGGPSGVGSSAATTSSAAPSAGGASEAGRTVTPSAPADDGSSTTRLRSSSTRWPTYIAPAAEKLPREPSTAASDRQPLGPRAAARWSAGDRRRRLGRWGVRTSRCRWTPGTSTPAVKLSARTAPWRAVPCRPCGAIRVVSRRYGSTTTLVPICAQFHIQIASGVDWRTHPPDSGTPSWDTDWTGRPYW